MHSFCVFRGSCGLILAASMVFLASCGTSNSRAVYPVRGKVTVNGKPVADCMIYLNNVKDDKDPNRVMPTGFSDENGDFIISSYGTNDGAPNGEYVITVEWKERVGAFKNNFEGDQLDGAYKSSENTKSMPNFVVKVQGKAVEVPTLDLKQTPEAKRRHEEWMKRQKFKLS